MVWKPIKNKIAFFGLKSDSLEDSGADSVVDVTLKALEEERVSEFLAALEVLFADEVRDFLYTGVCFHSVFLVFRLTLEVLQIF